MPDTHATVLSLAAEIVSAHVSNNAVSVDELPKLINNVHHALATVDQGAAEQSRPEPVVPVKQSVRADHLVCLDCGKHYSMLKRHLMADHKLTVDQYRHKWRLPGGVAQLREDTIRVGEEDWVGTYWTWESAEAGEGCTAKVIGLPQHKVCYYLERRDPRLRGENGRGAVRLSRGR